MAVSTNKNSYTSLLCQTVIFISNVYRLQQNSILKLSVNTTCYSTLFIHSLNTTRTTRPVQYQHPLKSPAAVTILVTEQMHINISEDHVDASKVEFKLSNVPGDSDCFFFAQLVFQQQLIGSREIQIIDMYALCKHIYMIIGSHGKPRHWNCSKQACILVENGHNQRIRHAM